MSLSSKKINHIAIIMDGNGRWAKKNSLNKKDGHQAGINAAIKISKSISKYSNIKHLTLYTFSTENWNRSPQEIRQLFELINLLHLETSSLLNILPIKYLLLSDSLILSTLTMSVPIPYIFIFLKFF